MKNTIVFVNCCKALVIILELSGRVTNKVAKETKKLVDQLIKWQEEVCPEGSCKSCELDPPWEEYKSNCVALARIALCLRNKRETNKQNG